MRRLALLLPLLLAGCAGRKIRVDDRPILLRVRPPVAFEMLRDNQDLPILDVRSGEEFEGEQGHLAGAVSLPLAQLPARLAEIALLKRRTFLIYCRQGDSCGEDAMRLLLERDFDDVVLIDGGLEAWIKAGFGTVGGPNGGVKAQGLSHHRHRPPPAGS